MSSHSVRRRAAALTIVRTDSSVPRSSGSGDCRRFVAPGAPPVSLAGIHKIKHVVVIMQENRSFDSYFGTFPGADGIPMKNGLPTVCLPDATTGRCQKPYVNHADANGGSPHDAFAAARSIDGGKMDGFQNVNEVSSGRNCPAYDPFCATGPVDVMGYHTQHDIPNYWRYASDYVLQDHMFEPNASWSLPEHLFQVSGWSAKCATHSPASCRNNDQPRS